MQKVVIDAVAQGGVRGALRPFRRVLVEAQHAKKFLISAWLI
jgi:hypothetical protein